MTQKVGLNRPSAVERRKIILVVLVEVLKDGKVLVVCGLVGGVRNKGFLRGNELLCFLYAAYSAETHRGDDRRADRADVLRARHDLYRSARAVRENLAGDIRESAAADKADGVGGLYLLVLSLEEPAQVHTGTLDNGAEKLSLACLEADIEEHSARVRIFERAAVAVQPRGEDNSAAACGDFVYDMGHIVVEARVYGLLRGGDVGLFQEDVDLIEHEVILDPLEAFARSLELGEVVESAVLRADYGGYHGVCVDDILVNDCVDPAGGAAIYMRVAQADRARAYAYEGGVAAAAEYGSALAKAELARRSFGQSADEGGGVDYVGHVLGLDVEHLEHLGAPALSALADIVEQSAEGRVAGHDKLAGHAANDVFLDVEPLIGTGEVLGLVLLDPFIFVDGVLDARGHRAGYLKRFEQLGNIGARYLRTVGHELLYLLFGALIHVAHRHADGNAVFVDEHKPLHLGAEGNAGYLRGADAR